jgi:hypothetical protein
MSGVHHGQKIFRRICGLQKRDDACAVGANLVFVGVDNIERGLLVEFARELEQRVRTQHIIVIKHDNVVTRRPAEGVVGGGCNAAIC